MSDPLDDLTRTAGTPDLLLRTQHNLCPGCGEPVALLSFDITSDSRAEDIEVGGEPLDHQRTYRLATINYLADLTTVREPVLTATKELSNVTAGKNPTDPLVLGDIVQYVVTITNAGSATAYDVNIVDTLPIELALSGDYTPTAAINNAPVAGFVGVPAGAPNGPLVWGRGNSDLSLDLPVRAFLALTYRVVVQAPPVRAPLPFPAPCTGPPS